MRITSPLATLAGDDNNNLSKRPEGPPARFQARHRESVGPIVFWGPRSIYFCKVFAKRFHRTQLVLLRGYYLLFTANPDYMGFERGTYRLLGATLYIFLYKCQGNFQAWPPWEAMTPPLGGHAPHFLARWGGRAYGRGRPARGWGAAVGGPGGGEV